MVSATCPLCTIYLVEANSGYASDLEAAEVEAVKLGAHIVTNRWACGSAAGADAGTGVLEPAAFDSVAAIGGTELTKQGSHYGESIWSNSAGGCAVGIKKPKWHHESAGIFGLAGDATRQEGGRTSWLQKHHGDLYTPSGGCAFGYSYGHYNECVGWGTPDGIGAF